MSRKYSTTPSLNLTLESSRHRQLFLFLLALAVALANYQTWSRGYPLLALGLMLASVILLWHSRRDPMVGAVLKWEAGEWFLRHRGGQTSVLLSPGAVRLPWLIYMDFRETHAKRRWRLWLFVDSADVEQIRRLRCRLALEFAG